MARGTPRGDAGRQGFDSADRHGGDLCFPSRTDCVQGNRCHEDSLSPRVPEQRRTAAGTARTSVVPDGCERHRRSDARPGIFYPPPTPLLHSELSGQGRPPAAALTTPSGFDQNPSPDRTSRHSCPSHFEPRSCHCSSRFSPKSVQLPPSKSSKRSSRITAARLTAFGARAHSPSSPGRGV